MAIVSVQTTDRSAAAVTFHEINAEGSDGFLNTGKEIVLWRTLESGDAIEIFVQAPWKIDGNLAVTAHTLDISASLTGRIQVMGPFPSTYNDEDGHVTWTYNDVIEAGGATFAVIKVGSI